MIMKIKKYWKIIIFIILFASIIFVLNNLGYNMEKLPKGEFLRELDSPNSEYKLKAYLYSGGATMDWTLRVELVNNETGKIKNIYWKYHDSEADIKWLDKDNVEINGKKLNVHKDTYDWRRD